MAASIDIRKLSGLLWQNDDEVVYAVLDGAGIPNLFDHLYSDPRPEFACLYRGELEPDIAEVAPYLVRLEPDSQFFEWVVSGWGNAWGIFAVAPANLDLGAIRRHFRKLNLVSGPDEKTLLFRYYDPRVLRIFLPTCDAVQLVEVFGPIRQIVSEVEDDSPVCKEFSLVSGNELVQRQIALYYTG